MSRMSEFEPEEIVVLHSLVSTRRNEIFNGLENEEGWSRKYIEAFIINSLLFELEDHIDEIMAEQE